MNKTVWIKRPLIRFGVPTVTGRIYHKKGISVEGTIFCTLRSPGVNLIGIKEVAGIASMKMTDEGLILDSIEFFDNIPGKAILSLIDKHGVDIFTTGGVGLIDEEKNVRDFRLTAVFIDSDKVRT